MNVFNGRHYSDVGLLSVNMINTTISHLRLSYPTLTSTFNG